MLNIPDYYVRVNSMPEDPENSISFCVKSSMADVFIIMYPIRKDETMPYEHPQLAIDSIHNSLTDRQGLIEVNSGLTASGRKLIYSIIKTLKEPFGVQYTLYMNVGLDDHAVSLQGFFDETGTTGMRDTYIFEMMMQEGQVSPDMSGWMCDPYDKDYKNGVQMNLSEQMQFDKVFPEHPLSIARQLVYYIRENN